MSSPNIRAARLSHSSSQTASFIPKEQIPVSYGKSTIYVYPPIEEGMSDAEKSYAYMTNKAAISSADIHPKVKLQAFGNATGCMSVVNVMMETFIKHANKWIFEAGYFEVISYHSRNGLTIPNCLDADGDLKETDGMAAADRRPANIQFVRLQSNIRFRSIDKDNRQAYPFSYFVRLPMELEVVQDDQNNDVHLYTFQGDPEWATDNDQENLDIILESDSGIGKPFFLAPSDIPDINADANIEVNLAVQALEKLALEASWDYITKCIFDSICPNFTADPSSVIQGITQQQKDEKTGEMVTLTVSQYHNAVRNCANFFPSSKPWEVDVVQHFQAHLLPEIKTQMKSIPYTYVSTPEKKTPFQQMKHLQLTFTAAYYIAQRPIWKR
jgi:hypothetical protein